MTVIDDKQGVSPFDAVGRVVIACPQATQTFIRHRIDYPDRSQTPLVDVCYERGVNTAEFIKEIYREPKEMPPIAQGHGHGVPEMIHSLICKHHFLSKYKLHELHTLLERSAETHGRNHPELIELLDLYCPFHKDLRLHMIKEENVVFPALLSLADTKKHVSTTAGSSFTALGSASMEHRDYVGILFRMLDVSGNYRIPPGSGTELASLYAGLKTLTDELMWTFFFENHFLFSRANTAPA